MILNRMIIPTLCLTGILLYTSGVTANNIKVITSDECISKLPDAMGKRVKHDVCKKMTEENAIIHHSKTKTSTTDKKITDQRTNDHADDLHHLGIKDIFSEDEKQE